MSKNALFAVIAASLILPAFAAAAATPTTEHFEVSSVSGTINPCTGTEYTVTFSAQGVFHTTTLADGSRVLVLAERQTQSWVPLDPSEPSYTGTLTATDQLILGPGVTEGNRSDTTLLKGSDGSLIVERLVMHITLSAGGVQTGFDHPLLICN